jgi:hypothetical protein
MDEACTAVGQVTDRAISAAIAGQKLPRWVTESRMVDRNPKPGTWGTHHTATSVKVMDGKQYVFDWQSTLMLRDPLISLLRDPLISRSLDEWRNYNDTYRVAFHAFQGWS